MKWVAGLAPKTGGPGTGIDKKTLRDMAAFLRELVREIRASYKDQVAEAPWSVAEWAVALRFGKIREPLY